MQKPKPLEINENELNKLYKQIKQSETKITELRTEMNILMGKLVRAAELHDPAKLLIEAQRKAIKKLQNENIELQNELNALTIDRCMYNPS